MRVFHDRDVFNIVEHHKELFVFPAEQKTMYFGKIIFIDKFYLQLQHFYSKLKFLHHCVMKINHTTVISLSLVISPKLATSQQEKITEFLSIYVLQYGKEGTLIMLRNCVIGLMV